MKRTYLILLIGLISFKFSNAQEMERKKPNIQATYEIVINAPIDKVWQALAVDYGGIGKWASGVNHVVEFSGEGITAKRFCSISASGFNDTRERIIRFEPENFYFEYELYEGLPGFVKYSINKDQLVAEGNKTRWISSNDMRVGGFFGLTMKWMMRGQLKKVLQQKAEELKHFIETGKPHPRKLEIIAKKAAKDKKMRSKVVSIEVVQQINATPESVWQAIGPEFDAIADKHPDCPFSEWAPGYDKAEVGAMRIMYMSDSREKKYFVDQIAEYDPENYRMTIEIVDKKGFGTLNKDYTWVNMNVIPLGENSSELHIQFNYLTKPRFLRALAKGSLRRAFTRYARGIAHYVTTGQTVDGTNWKTIEQQYKN